MLHDTFAVALAGKEKVAEAISPRAWLFAIARNLAATSIRRRKCAKPLAQQVAATVEADNPELDAMRDAAARLPDDLRQTLALRLRDGLSYEEIAAVLGIPLGTVRSRLHRAVRELRRMISSTRE